MLIGHSVAPAISYNLLAYVASGRLLFSVYRVRQEAPASWRCVLSSLSCFVPSWYCRQMPHSFSGPLPSLVPCPVVDTPNQIPSWGWYNLQADFVEIFIGVPLGPERSGLRYLRHVVSDSHQKHMRINLAWNTKHYYTLVVIVIMLAPFPVSNRDN